MFADIGQELRSLENDSAVLVAISEIASREVPGADCAGITVGRRGNRFVTVAATGELVRTVDTIQYDLGQGPALDAVLHPATYCAADLRTDVQWPDFGPRAFEMTGVVSSLSSWLYSDPDRRMTVGLNMYSATANAFEDLSKAVAGLICTHGALALKRTGARSDARTSTTDLNDSREIGIAIGILMAQQDLTRVEALDLLLSASQQTHRRVVEVATDFAHNGVMFETPKQRPLG
jgi:hypothetical protein